jgi:two-component system cell cycle sensor histidine kinase/response regulator CckA
MNGKAKTPRGKKTGTNKGRTNTARRVRPAAPATREARFRAIFESSRDVIGVSLDGVHVFVNPAYLKLFGIPQEAAHAGRQVLDLVAPASRDRTKEYILRRMCGESVPSAYETRGLRTDGSEFDIEVDVSLDQEKGRDNNLVILRDITRRKMVEAEIAERGALLQQIMDTASVGIGLVDKSGRITHANRRMAEMFGCTMEELIGSEYVDHVHPAERETGRENMLALLASKISAVDLERLYRRKDGTEFWGHLACRRFRDVHGNERGLIGVITDITEGKRSELALKQSEAKYRRLYNETPVLLHSIDRNGIVVDVNDFWLETLGYKRHEVMGKKVTDFFSDASRKYAEEVTLPAFFRDGIVKDVSYQFVKKNGDIVDVLLSAIAERDAAGNMVRSKAVIQDITERKRMEEALSKSEKMLQTIIEAEPECVKILDENANLIMMNRAGLDMLQADSLDQVKGQCVCPLVASDYRSAFMELTKRVFKGESGTLLFEMSGIKGRSLWLETHAVPLRNEKNEITALLGVTRDVTERKRAEEELREKEGQFRLLFEAANDGIFILGETGFLDCNRKGAEMYGLPKEQIIGRSPVEFSPERQLDGRLSSHAAAERIRGAMNGIPQMFEWQSLRADGSPIDVEITLSRLELGGKVCLQAIVRDITERKKTVNALRSSEARFRSIIEHATEGILVADAETRQIRYANPQFCRMLGYSEQELIGLDATDLTIEEETSESVAGFKAHVKGQAHSTQRTFRRKNGSPLRMNINSAQMELDGRSALLGFFADVTAQQLLEEERLKNQKIESLGTLAGGIAHDFNNLLQGVFGYISMAKLTHDQKEKSLAMLEQAEKALHQSVSLTSQLLTFSKGGKPLKKVISLQPVIEDAVKFALSGSRAIFGLSIADDLRHVEADAGQIGQVIQNIVLNADQAMPLGGRIDLSARNVSAASVAGLPQGLQGELVEISVRDQGLGIPPEHVARIFDPYFTTKEKGSGLGLATSYSIIRNHGGAILVTSELGKGSLFTIYLPASSAAQELVTEYRAGTASQKCRILVMDDDAVVRDVAVALLTELGHEVEIAEHGEAAIEKYRKAMGSGKPFDLVILDLTVRGGMGGSETIQKLQAIHPNVKAIVSSGYSDDTALSSYREQGFRAFMKKPYTMQELKDTLDALLA